MGLKQPPIREKGAKSSKKNLKNQVKLMMMSVVRCEMLLVPPRCVKDEPRNTHTHTHTHTHWHTFHQYYFCSNNRSIRIQSTTIGLNWNEIEALIQIQLQLIDQNHPAKNESLLRPATSSSAWKFNPFPGENTNFPPSTYLYISYIYLYIYLSIYIYIYIYKSKCV